MEVKIANPFPASFSARTTVPSVVRLPNGHVQMTGDSARFPDSCLRCGSSPAKTMVKLRLTKPLFKSNDGIFSVEAKANLRLVRTSLFKNSNRRIKIPFCRCCGWTLKIIQFLPGILGAVVIGILDPLIQNFRPRQVPWFSAGTAFFAGMMTAGLVTALFEYMPRLFLRPGVKIVAITKDSAELAFDDLMYAERFVLLNR
jgi:hypothetical protein